MSYIEAGPMPAQVIPQVSAEPHEETREERLEALIRRILPRLNLSEVEPETRRNMLREFSDLRNGTHTSDVEFTNGRCLMWVDQPILSTARVDGREALLMRVPEDEAGANYLMLVTSERVMDDVRNDRICLRTACLHERTQLYLTDECVEGAAAVLHGPVHEYLLPSPGLFLASEYANPDEPEEDNGMSM